MKYKWQTLPPIEAAQNAAAGNPLKLPWGFFSADDLSIGGFGGFCWFASSDELIAFVSEVMLALPQTEDADTKAQIQQCRDSVANLQKPETALLSDINEVIESENFRIEWWGNFDQLCEDGGDFPEMMRVKFRDPEGDADEENPAPIKSSSRTKFAAFIAEYTSGG